MQIPLLNGVYSDAVSDFRTSYPRNMVPVPKGTGISEGYLRSAPGFETFAIVGVGLPAERGGINWNGVQYRVIGSQLYRINADGTSALLGDVDNDGKPVRLDYSFDRLGIASARKLFYWDGVALTQVTDPDLGLVVDMMWLGGYFFTTDGASLVVTDLTDPTQVNPLKYGSSEFDPDPVKAVWKLRNEAYALNRHTIQVFQNVGGNGFPFALIQGALVTRGIIGTHAVDELAGALAFVGSGRNEQPSVYVAGSGETQKIATREIEQILRSYTEAELAAIECETREHDGHVHFHIHLPDQTLVYDAAASAAVGEPVWLNLSSDITSYGLYRARHFVWCYDEWTCGVPPPESGGVIYKLVDTRTGFSGAPAGWQFETQLIYNDGRGFILHSLELVPLTGRSAAAAGGSDLTEYQIAVQYTLDGLTWTQKRFVSLGKSGQTLKRLQWRAPIAVRHRNWVGLRFSGQQPQPIAFARLEAQIEPLAA